MELSAKKIKKKKRQMQEEYMAFFLRHIVLNGVVWLKPKRYVFRRLRRMFRHNGLKDSLSHFISPIHSYYQKSHLRKGCLAVSLPLERLPFSRAA